MAQGDSFYYPEPPRKQRGCFFYGCLFSSILALVMLLSVGVGTFYLYQQVNQLVVQFTDTAPVPIPEVETGPDDLARLKQRLDTFKKALETGEESTLTLTTAELNALIADHSEFRGRASVAIEDDKLAGQVSIPLDSFGFKGRYLNGQAKLKASLEGGVLIVTLDELVVRGKPIPDNAMASLSKENLAKDAYRNPENARLLRKLESLEIQDGRIILKSRASRSAGPGPGPHETAEPPATGRDGASELPEDPFATVLGPSAVSSKGP